jgi:potassium-transporting ATPase KdpC subunit
MTAEIWIALRATIATLVLTGILYPLAITGISQTVLRDAADGSLVRDEHGNVVGSRLIAQAFSNPAYLQPRPSAAGATGYDATSSSGSNLGPMSQKLRDRVEQDVQRLKNDNPDADDLIPADLVTTSASGLDPHLTPPGARWQIARIAKARQVDPQRVRNVIEANVEPPTLGLLGEPRVNVLETNLALDRQFGKPH